MIRQTTRLLLVILSVMLNFTAFANNPFSKGELTGNVNDSISGESLPFSSIRMLSLSDSLIIQAVVADYNGNFNFKNIDFGTYRFIASYMGYSEKEVVFVIDKVKMRLDISLSAKSFALSEIEILSEKKLLENTIEKTTVNISKNTTLSAGTALDALQTAPSVDVDIDGKISYRGSDKVMILINGEKSELVNSLSQIPSDAIEKIEIISNPSAKYDAEGMSGIINVVLKSGQKNSNNNTIVLNAGYHENYGGSVGYSKSFDKLQFFINAGANRKGVFQTKEHYRANYENPNVFDYSQFDSLETKQNNAFLNTNLNYKLNKKNKIGAVATISKSINRGDRAIDYKTYNQLGYIEQDQFKNIDIKLDNYAFEGSVNFKRNFNKKGQQLKTKAQYSAFNQTQEMNNELFSILNSDIPELQNTCATQQNRKINLSIDYTQAVNDSIIIETGYKGSLQDIQNIFSSESYNYGFSDWLNDTALNNKFSYGQSINALYFNISTNFSFINIQAGIRGEHTTTLQDNNNNQEYLSLFPSILLSKKAGSHNTIHAGFNRRINRPTIKMLNPFTDEYADVLNMHKGNPDLKPEFVNSFELGNRYVYDKISGAISFYYRDIQQAISRIKAATNDSALVVSFMNLDKAKMIGGDFSFSLRPYKWWNINFGGNVFHTALTGESENYIIDKDKLAWNSNITTQFNLPKNISIRFSGYYRSKLPSVMGIYKERYFTDFAISKKIFKNKGQLVFKISDPFNTYKFGLDLDAVDINGFSYSQLNRKKNESRYFILSFKYNVNSKNKQTKTKKEKFYLDKFDK
ncbi:MAG: outer membrane beta-barrel family protein [Bacteroidota bacterium]|nr:outer membrane beta-barrel family protein [Bacteroidota bacterium]